MNEDIFKLRRGTPDDMNIVAASFFESWRRGGRAPEVQFPVYKEGAGRHIQRLLDRASVTVVYVDGIPNEVAAWSLHEGDTLHFIYVKNTYRRQGLGSYLARGFKYHSHETKAFKYLDVQTLYNPWRAE